MSARTCRSATLAALAVLAAAQLSAQPSFTAPAPAPVVLKQADLRRAAYEARVDEVVTWRTTLAKPGELLTDMGVIAAKLVRFSTNVPIWA